MSFVDAIDRAAAWFCHREEARSFVGPRDLTFFCARCTGVYTGALIGALAKLAARVPVPLVAWILVPAYGLLAVGAADPLFPDALWHSTNGSRFTTGLGAGVGMAAIFLALRSPKEKATRRLWVFIAVLLALAAGAGLLSRTDLAWTLSMVAPLGLACLFGFVVTFLFGRLRQHR